MLYVLPSNNPQSDATGALPVILHTAGVFREGHSGGLLPRWGKMELRRQRRLSDIMLRTW